MKTWILASNSPRRKELLDMLCIPFTIQVSDVDERALEQHYHTHTPIQKAAYTAQAKALAVSKTAPKNSIVVAADTIVALQNEILHKPKNADDAFQILSKLSSNTHTVYTGLSLVITNADGEQNVLTDVSQTNVTFRMLTEPEIKAYIATGEPMDKAGAYGIQGKGALFVEKIEGDYYTVMGLPLVLLHDMLKPYGITLYDFWNR